MSKDYGNMMVQYLSFLNNDSAVKVLIDNFKKIDSNKFDIENKPFYKWCQELKKYD
jgi:hypothetical protein